MAVVVFEKRAGKYDAMLVTRDGRVEEIPCPKQRPIPHDMFHFAVETVLQKRGFMHRAAAGEGVGFRMADEPTSNAVERLVETMQADTWSGRPDPAEVIELFETTCAARGDAPFALDGAMITAMRAEIDRLAGLWEPLRVGERLELEIV
ncbi:MAG: hypothetical protein JNM47_14890 [Hyphomonadaceae bacterium]|nr:hypothetical protein [Hyphomonadaceae bacterium]